jgi:HCOMODA/2-hydroxy-3-carboxy-muconic semialdehyde decarboxylase
VPLWNGTEALPVFDLRPFNRGRSGIISTPALGKAMAEKLGKAEAVLLWGHGIAIGAKSIPEVITRVAELRDSAQVQQAVVANGGTWKPMPRPVDDAAVERTWAYHKAAVVEQMGGKVLMTAPARPANPTDPAERAKLDLVLANHILSADDVGVLDTVGHVSVRNPSNPNTYFVAPKLAPGSVKKADVVERDMTKGEADTQGLTLDDEIYKAHPEVKAILYARTPEITAFSGSTPLRATVNGGNFIGEGLPKVDVKGSGPGAVVGDTALGAAVAKALDRKGAVLLSENGIVVTGATIYNITGRAYQIRQNARIQQQAVALKGKVNYLVDLPDPGGAAEGGEGRGGRGGGAPNAGAGPQGAPGQGGGQQLGPPEGRDWVYWVGNTKVE